MAQYWPLKVAAAVSTMHASVPQPDRCAEPALVRAVRRALEPGSSFQSIGAFEVRPAQLALSCRIAEAFGSGGGLIAESATGTGKTLAYLVPALLDPGRTVISTGNHELQDQLIRKDIPQIQRALGSDRRVVLLKGRANYLCRLRAAAVPSLLVPAFEGIREWAAATTDGDLAAAPGLLPGDPLWGAITADADQCLGGGCSAFDRCFVQKARREATEADLVVVNHHLFLADRRLGEEGFARLLPATHHVVFDEAHQLPAIAGGFFGSTFASRSLRQWCDLLEKADRTESLAVDGLSDAVEHLRQLLVRVAMAAGPAGTRMALADAAPDLEPLLALIGATLSAVLAPLVAAGARGELSSLALRQGPRLHQVLMETLTVDGSQITWIEAGRGGFSLHRTPAISGPEFRQALGLNGPQPAPAYVFLSATLSVDGDFSYFQRMLDLGDLATGRWEGAFDYTQQALLYLPPDLPDPRDPEFLDRFVECVLAVLAASQGRAFLLFTTHKVLGEVHQALTGRLEFPLFVQGTMPRARLLESFRAAGNGVLLGTASFWEGVDVAGAALSCVVIDKLPFTPPHDPVERARLQMLKSDGINGFRDYQLPRAVLALKQGVGRLIRTHSDYGVVVLCDARLQTQSYGKVFLASLPPMPVTHALAQVEAFFQERWS